MPFEDPLATFNTIDSVYKYKIRCQSELTYDYDNQDLIQVGTDKDWIAKNPDIAPSVGSGLTNSNTIWISWTGDNANAGTDVAPKRSFLDGGYNSAGDGALTAALAAGYNIAFISGETDMWVEPVIIPKEITLYKYQTADTPTLRTCKRTLPNSGNFTDATAIFVDPNVAGAGTGTQADPFKSLQDAIDNIGALSYIIIFNSGVAGTPGDNVSLVFNECIAFYTIKTVTILSGIQWDTNWFSAGDSAFFAYTFNTNYREITTIGTPTGMSGIEFNVGASYMLANITNDQYMNYGNLAAITSRDVTGGSETLYDIAYYTGTSQMFVATASRIRKASSPFSSWSDATTGTAFYRLEVWNNYLYAWSGTNVYYTSDGSTFTSIYTFDISYTATFRPIEFNNKLYFMDNSTRELYYIDKANTVIKEIYTLWDSIQSMEVLEDNLYLFVTKGADNQIYKFDGDNYTLIFTSSNSVYDWRPFCKTFENMIYCSAYDSTTEYIYIFNGINLIQVYSDGVTTSRTNCFRPLAALDERSPVWGVILLFASGPVAPIMFLPGQIWFRTTNISLQNLDFDGSNYAVYGVQSANSTQYLNLHNHLFSNFFYQTYPVINSILSDSVYGVGKCHHLNNPNLFEYNLIYNQSKAALLYPFITGNNSRIYMKYCTIDNCKYAIVFLATRTSLPTVSEVENNIFSRVGQILYDTSNTDIDLISSVIPPNCILDGCTLDTNTITAIPAYRNRDGEDYRLQAKGGESSNGSYYFFDSPGVGLGFYTTGRLGSDIHGDTYTFLNDGDAGCYQIAIAVYNKYWNQEWLMNPYPNSLNINPLFKSKTSFQSREGSTRKTFQSMKRQFIFNWEADNVWDYGTIQKFINLLDYSYEMMLSYNTPLASEYSFVDQAAWLASPLRTNIIATKVGVTSGQASSVFTKADMTLVTTNSWVVNQFKGYYVRLIDQTDQSTGSDFVPQQSLFRIESNTATTLTLSNPFQENLAKYAATVDVATDDLMYIISDIKVLFDIETDLNYLYTILSGLNISDQFPPALISSLTFEEVL